MVKIGVPATKGNLKTTIKDMNIGDYIPCKYVASSGKVGVFSEFGTNSAIEIPLLGADAPNGIFYFVKVDKGFLITDRVLQVNISWDTLNTGQLIEGRTQSFDGYNGRIRSLSGGIAYSDANMNTTLDARLSSGKCFPTNNEYDKYLMGFPKRLIQSGSTLDDVFHHRNKFTWTKDTTLTGARISSTGTTENQDNTYRVLRGNEANFLIWSGLGMGKSSSPYDTTGFRPGFVYKEV